MLWVPRAAFARTLMWKICSENGGRVGLGLLALSVSIFFSPFFPAAWPASLYDPILFLKSKMGKCYSVL